MYEVKLICDDKNLTKNICRLIEKASFESGYKTLTFPCFEFQTLKFHIYYLRFHTPDEKIRITLKPIKLNLYYFITKKYFHEFRKILSKIQKEKTIIDSEEPFPEGLIPENTEILNTSVLKPKEIRALFISSKILKEGHLFDISFLKKAFEQLFPQKLEDIEILRKFGF